MFGPSQVDQQLRAAIAACSMALPPTRQNMGEAELEIPRLVERVLKNLREDAKSLSRYLF